MTEKHVTLKTAETLKKLGFPQDDNYKVLYDKDGNYHLTYIAFPPQSIVQKWLRDEKNLHITIYNCACGYGYEISRADDGTHVDNSNYEGPNDGGEWDTYEEALEDGILKSLKLI